MAEVGGGGRDGAAAGADDSPELQTPRVMTQQSVHEVLAAPAGLGSKATLTDISKTLSYFLRYGAHEAGLHVHPGGYLSLDALLAHPRFTIARRGSDIAIPEADESAAGAAAAAAASPPIASLPASPPRRQASAQPQPQRPITEEEVRFVVQHSVGNGNTRRFELSTSGDRPGHTLIRATYGRQQRDDASSDYDFDEAAEEMGRSGPVLPKLLPLLNGLVDAGLDLSPEQLCAVKPLLVQAESECADLSVVLSQLFEGGDGQSLGLSGVRELRDIVAAAFHRLPGSTEGAAVPPPEEQEGEDMTTMGHSHTPAPLAPTDAAAGGPSGDEPHDTPYFKDNRTWPKEPTHTRQEVSELLQTLIHLAYDKPVGVDTAATGGPSLHEQVQAQDRDLNRTRRWLREQRQQTEYWRTAHDAARKEIEELHRRLARYEQRQQDNKRQYHRQHRNVHILWDIENITIPKNACAAKVSYRLLEFLDYEGVMNKSDSHFHFRAYYRPHETGLLFSVQRDLTRAGVELIAVASTKQEAADRIIENSINRVILAPDADPDNTTLVVVSSDFDFVVPLENARSRGFRVVLVHSRNLTGVRKDGFQRRAHAKMFVWEDIMERLLEEARKFKRQARPASVAPAPLSPPELETLKLLVDVHFAPGAAIQYGELCQAVEDSIRKPTPELAGCVGELCTLFRVKATNTAQDDFRIEYSATKNVLFRAQLAGYVVIEKTTGGSGRINRRFRIVGQLPSASSALSDGDSFPLLPQQSSDAFDSSVLFPAEDPLLTTVRIEATRLVNTSSSYTVYQLRVRTNDERLDPDLPPGTSREYLVEKRYSELKLFHASCAADLGLAPMPPLKIFKFASSVIASRARAFEDIMKTAVAQVPLHPAVIGFLRPSRQIVPGL